MSPKTFATSQMSSFTEEKKIKRWTSFSFPKTFLFVFLGILLCVWETCYLLSLITFSWNSNPRRVGKTNRKAIERESKSWMNKAWNWRNVCRPPNCLREKKDPLECIEVSFTLNIKQRSSARRLMMRVCKVKWRILRLTSAGKGTHTWGGAANGAYFRLMSASYS